MKLPLSQVLAALVVLTATSGCSTYREKPVDLAAFDALWQARSADDVSVAAYAEKIRQHGALTPTRVDMSDGINLSEAELLALVFNPQLHAARVRAGVSIVDASVAGRWDDPAIDVDVLRALEGGPSPWTVLSGISLSLPLSGRLGVARTHAQRLAAVDKKALAAMEWAHLAVLRDAWVMWSTTAEQQRMASQFAKEATALATIADKLHTAGEISVVGARAIHIAAQRAALVAQELTAVAEQQALGLRNLIGFSPQAPVQFLPTVTLSEDMRAQLQMNGAMTSAPLVQIAVARHQASEAALRLEVRRQYPDLNLGLAYENDRGDRSLGPSFGFTLPLWNGNGPAIASATAVRDADAAAVHAAYAAATHDWSQAQIALRDRSERLRVMQEQLVPLVDAQVTDVHRLALLGDFEVAIVLEVLDAAWQVSSNVVSLQAELTQAENRLIALTIPSWLCAEDTTAGEKP